MKRTVRLNEADLHRIIKESVKRVVNEQVSDSYIKSVSRQIYSLACHVMNVSDFNTAIEVLEGVINDMKYYEDEKGPYQTQHRNLENSWEHNHYGQIDTSDGKFWGSNY